jgi:hypothetical protein
MATKLIFSLIIFFSLSSLAEVSTKTKQSRSPSKVEDGDCYITGFGHTPVAQLKALDANVVGGCMVTLVREKKSGNETPNFDVYHLEKSQEGECTYGGPAKMVCSIK